MFVSGAVKGLLRVEALVVTAVTVWLYSRTGAGWGQFALLFLVPDLSLLGYLWSPRVGALTYNTVHSWVGPLALGAAALGGLVPAALPIALIWGAHVGFDRAMGYGLKYASGFGHTHLGEVKLRKAAPAPAASGA